jgi:hypothetical protein
MVDMLVEGDLDMTVALRVLRHVGLSPGRPFGRTGRADFFARLPRYNQAAGYGPWIALVDLETSPSCVPHFVTQHLPNPSQCMRFRVAVHAIESWLMADGDTLARFLRVSEARLPPDPDTIQHPKQHLINIARRSRIARVRVGVVPRAGSGASQGPLYTSLLQDFVMNYWQPDVAAQNSPSLNKCLLRLQSLPACIPV